MDLVKYTAQLDLTDNGCFDTGWRIKQGDYGNSQILISLVDNGVNAFDANVTPQINFKRPDGKSVLANMTVEQNVYSYIFVGNELEIAGTVLMDVKFITPQGRTSSASCKFTCVEDTIGIDSTGASTYYNPVSEIIAEAGGYAEAVADLQQNKQNKLIAGRNITIDEETNIISASGGGGGGASAAVDVSYDNTTTQMSANNVQDAIDEVFHSVGNGKELIASAISDKGIPTLATDTFAIMAEHIAEIEGGASGGGQTYFKFYDPVGGTKVDSFTSTMNGTLKLVAVGYMNAFATIKINGNVIPYTESYYITSHYYYYVYVETQVNKNDVIEISGTATGTSSFSILASIVGDGMDIADTTAIESDVLSGKIFHKADGTKAWGTYAEPKIFPLTVRVDELRDLIIEIPNGGYNPVVYGLAEEEKAKVIPENIKKDVEILGVTGTFEGEGGTDVSDTTAIKSDVASGKVFHLADGSRAVGTYEAPMITNPTVRVDSLDDNILTNIGNVVYKEVTYGLKESEKAKVIPENIKKDVTILGVTGTLESGSNVKNGAITLTTADQTINCGFKPTQVCVCVGANRTNYFGFGINTNGTTVGSRVASGSSTSATSPATITITDDGFKVRAMSSSYALASTYYAVG